MEISNTSIVLFIVAGALLIIAVLLYPDCSSNTDIEPVMVEYDGQRVKAYQHRSTETN